MFLNYVYCFAFLQYILKIFRNYRISRLIVNIFSIICYEPAKELIEEGKGWSTMVDVVLVVDQCRSIDDDQRWSQIAIESIKSIKVRKNVYIYFELDTLLAIVFNSSQLSRYCFYCWSIRDIILIPRTIDFDKFLH